MDLTTTETKPIEIPSKKRANNTTSTERNARGAKLAIINPVNPSSSNIRRPNLSVKKPAKKLEKIIEEIDEKLKEYHCPIEMSVPIIPFKARTLKQDNPAFTLDNFEARAIFKTIKLRQRHPITQSPLYFRDIGDLLIINKKLLKKLIRFF